MCTIIITASTEHKLLTPPPPPPPVKILSSSSSSTTHLDHFTHSLTFFSPFRRFRRFYAGSLIFLDHSPLRDSKKKDENDPLNYSFFV